MEISKYQEIATRTHNNELNLNESITCYGLGLSQTTGNVTDQIKQHMFCNVPIDKGLMIAELSESLWNIANLAGVLGINLDAIAGHRVNVVMMNKPNRSIAVDDEIKQGDNVLLNNVEYCVDGVIGNLLLISNDEDDRQVSVQDVKKVNKE
ncbi:nucleoside triphosphate pyrophosphohydrolase family protein [Staphylococcus aureus]|nr:nucleoside triphosphate pyrophosphohydrolase family protein [Staphylococcus aureus]MBH4716422.1 nucleoside triphosphate pyrophosphohydrolase family protein [Staphylococcus aureus]MBH4718822.1 nucleoside triphosphate pyrophosphohydrolase family protein [Staphylococcus aureus]MBH4722173.1 nucleoside triphosphate pyrophosphohydrolase family protein [Staphylococcus aureus]MBH4724042.1 nucleoside triphosphate pyrophosphohydrolase family protein [Staphylococcus aureus]